MAAKVDFLTLTAVELQGLLTRRVVSSVDITTKYLDQIEKHNHAGLKLNTVISTAPREAVLIYADQLDEGRQRGAIRGPFHGAPVLLKDAYSTPGVGLPTTCGSFALTQAKAKAKANAKVVDKLIAAGMIVIAKANLSEWGDMKGINLISGWSAVRGQRQAPYVKGGVTLNATWLTHSAPAGSSSGSAAGVAAGVAPASLGTESDGSIIIPACRAGLYAIKITRGTVDDTGVQPALRQFDCLGGFAKTPIDLAHLVVIMQGHEAEEYLPLSPSWESLKIGFLDPTKWRSCPSALEPVEGFWAQTDAAMFAAQERYVNMAERLVPAIPLISFDEITAAMLDMEYMEDLNPYQIREVFDGWLSSFDGAPQTIEDLIEFNKAHADQEFTTRDDNQLMLEAVRDCTTTKEEFERNMKALRDKAASAVAELLRTYDVDVIVGPCDSRTGSVGSAAGFPTANLPLGFAHFNGRGFGLHMIAPQNQEAKMLQIMAAWEAAFPEGVHPSPLLVES